MSVSTLPNYFTKEKRLLFVGESLPSFETKSEELPNNFQRLSYLSLKEMVRNFDLRMPLPEAIIINLNSVSINRLSGILKRIQSHQHLKFVPLIAIKLDYSLEQRIKLMQLGFNDCFSGLFEWETIQQRVKFLNKYKQKLTVKKHTIDSIELDQPYQIPFNKRVFDIVVASVLLLCLSPLFLIVAILIKLESKGNIFYSSKRIGTGYREFNFIKFRSMFVGADATLVKLAHLNNYTEEHTKKPSAATFFKMKDDPRVTRIGKFIRKTSIDELPQLLNVLRGEMSIVGNRPLPLYEAKQLTCDDWAKRFLAPAGLTGLWQVDERGKDNLPAEERIRLDMNYADNYSFWLDFKILLKTFKALKQRE